MMNTTKRYNDKKVCIIDNGLFLEIGFVLARDFGKVYYHSPWISAFPRSNDMLVGEGFDQVTRINNVFDIIDDVDLFVFPDIYYSDLQLYLEKQGKRVWGSRKGDELELNRDESKRYLKSLGIDVGKYKVVHGVKELREYLKKNENQWIKLSITRGDTETFHAPSYRLVEPRLDDLETRLGAIKDTKEFIVEQAIDDAVESGFDGICIDGQFMGGMTGIEIKDKGYISIWHDDIKSIPLEITSVNDKLATTFNRYRYRNMWSTELRITRDKKSYLIDPCCRFGSPPNEIMMNMIDNLAEVMWEGSIGIPIKPIIKGKYGVELIIHSQWADQHWQAIDFPPEYKDNVIFRNFTKINNEYYVVPQEIGLPEIGAIVSINDNLEKAIEETKEIAEQVKSYDLHVYSEILDDAQKEINKLQEWGIDIL